MQTRAAEQSDVPVTALVKVYDSPDFSPSTVNLSPQHTVLSIEKSVASLLFACGIESADIDLILHFDDSQIHLTGHHDKNDTLRDLNVTIDPALTYVITVSTSTLYINPEGHNLNLNQAASEDDLQLGASASPTGGGGGGGDDEQNNNNEACGGGGGGEVVYGPPLLGVGGTLSTSSTIGEGDPMADDSAPSGGEDGVKYVGLVNQAMTCYLNSLVQALYMTPEFRNAIYNWEFDGMIETRSIPYQLQKLFLNLQTSDRSAVETTDLTTSFGWQGSEAWHQHDIQELCRVMFDALERKFKHTKQANLINDLYEGTMLDYVKCLECGTEKSREDKFLDIPLPVRPFGSTVAYNSVEEALRAFVQPETLDGNNQYHCERCDKKCDAHKGLKFIKFPYLLTLHLKRFAFDYTSMHRIKLNDKVVFPEVLNLNAFINNDESSSTSGPSTTHLLSTKFDFCCTADSGSVLDDESCQGTDSSAVNSVNGQEEHGGEDSDEGIDVSSGHAHTNGEDYDNQSQPVKPGPYTYELFSIMIHSGSASGGHYYAYIKDFDKGHWLCFNDQSVNRITDDDIRKSFGGGPHKGYYSGVYTSSTNAYMLMYRQVDACRNKQAMRVEEFPEHMKKLLAHLKVKEEMDRVHKEKQNNSCRLMVFCRHPSTGELMEHRITVYGDSTLRDGSEMAHRRFKLEGLVEVSDCRLVLYNRKQGCIDRSYDSDDVVFSDVFNMFYHMESDWLLDYRPCGADFVKYAKGGVNMRVYVIDSRTEDITEASSVRVDVDDSVKTLRAKLAAITRLDGPNVRMMLQKFGRTPRLLDDAATVPFESDSQGVTKVFVNDGDLDEANFRRVIDKFKSVVLVNVLLPPNDAVTLENQSIPSLEPDEDGGNQSAAPPHQSESPQPTTCSSGDQSNSEDSSLSDSDRTLVGDAPDDSQTFFNNNNNNNATTTSSDHHMTSPEDGMYNYDVMGNPADEMNWDTTGTNNNNYYFNCVTSKSQLANKDFSRTCRVVIDSHMTLDCFKRHVEPLIQVPRDYFKVYRNNCETDELSNLSDSLGSLRDNSMVSVKLGRILSSNEFTCKVYHLKLRSNGEVVNQFLCDYILTGGLSVAQVKKDLLVKVKKSHLMDVGVSKCRLREKCSKRPGKVYLDDQLFRKDISIISNHEMYLQEVSEERVTSVNQVVLFVRHWRPHVLVLEPFQELVLDSLEMSELKRKISEDLKGNIPEEFVQVAFVKTTFPCDMHLLDIHGELDWNINVERLDQWPVHVDDGFVVFYRDAREDLKELTADERKELSIKENVRLGRSSHRNNVSHSWEKSLKIYSDNWPSESEDNCTD